MDATRDKGGAQSGGVPKNSAIPVRFSDSRYHSGHPLLRVPFRVETTRTCRRYARFVPIVAVTTHNKSATHSTPQARHQVRQRDENFLKTLTDGRFFRAGESSDDFMTVFYFTRLRGCYPPLASFPGPSTSDRIALSALAHSMVVVVAVFEVRGVAEDQGIAVFVEAVKDPKPGQAAQPVRPSFVEQSWFVKGQALVRHAWSAAAA